MAAAFVNGNKVAYASETISTLTSSTALTSTVYKVNKTTNPPFDATQVPDEAYISIETADVRVTFDGTTPTVSAGTAVGHLFGAGDVITLSGYEAIQKFRAINAVDASGANLRVTYWRR